MKNRHIDPNLFDHYYPPVKLLGVEVGMVDGNIPNFKGTGIKWGVKHSKLPPGQVVMTTLIGDN